MTEPAPRTMPCPHGPALVYVAARNEPEIHIIDHDGWDPERLPARDRALLKALLEHSLTKLADAERRD